MITRYIEVPNDEEIIRKINSENKHLKRTFHEISEHLCKYIVADCFVSYDELVELNKKYQLFFNIQETTMDIDLDNETFMFLSTEVYLLENGEKKHKVIHNVLESEIINKEGME